MPEIDLTVTAIADDKEADDEEEMDAAEENCEVGELPSMNINRNKTKNNYFEGDPDEPTEVEVLDIHMWQLVSEESSD